MYDTFFERQFSSLRGYSTVERKNEIINYMINEFTLYVLSTVNYDDYVIPNYVRKMLHNYTYDFIDMSDTGFDYVKVYFPDFKIIFDDKTPLRIMERELQQKIKKYTKLNAVTLWDYQDYDDLRKIFAQTEPNEVVDVVIVNSDDYHETYSGDVYVRDINSPYLIHKFLCNDDDVYTAVKETNRSITEFMEKFESQYHTTFFL